LIRKFHYRLLDLPENRLEMSSEKISIGVIGSGTMGAGIAQVAATAGHKVYVFDTSKAALQKAEQSISKILNRLTEKGSVTKENAAKIADSIVWADSLNHLSRCGLIIEAIIENLEIKQNIFCELEKIVGTDTVLASNTSSLSIASVAAACNKPERVIGIHFFNPAPLMPLVEIIPAVQTSDETLLFSKKIIDSWGKKTVFAKDTPGFIVNRVARPFYGEAIRIYEEGIADFATIDYAMKNKGGFKMGPFELMDYIGNDINYTVTETVFREFFYDSRYKPSFTQKRMMEAKRLGRKTGKGYYDYSENSVLPAPVLDDKLHEKIFMRILCMLINEAADALYLNIANKEDIDMAMTKGVNYPKGLLKWADEIGVSKVLSCLEQLQADYAEDRYRPSFLLKKMSKDGKSFY
jgi:3-hydroxybutyryl-CoA dehydrogenase